MAVTRAEQILADLQQLKPGTTRCAGMLARRLGTTQRLLRPTLLDLEADGKIMIRQRGHMQKLATLRGPYRVCLPQ